MVDPKGYYIPVFGLGVYENKSARDAVVEALRTGYRQVDTAQAYDNEAQVGQGLRDSGIDRGDVFITTKIVSASHGYESTLQGVDESLARFQFDYIDLFLIHDPLGGAECRLAMYKALQEAKKAGKIRTVGVSNFGIKHLEEIRNAGYDMPAINQIELHPFCQQRPLVDYCQKNGIVIQAYSPLVRGLKMDDKVLLELARKHGRDVAQILLGWSLQKGFITLPKSATPSRIRSNFEAFDVKLDEQDMGKLDALDKGKEGAVTWNPVDAP